MGVPALQELRRGYTLIRFNACDVMQLSMELDEPIAT